MRDAELLARIVEASEDAIISASPDGLITSWNGGAERLLGYTAVEAMGKPIAMLAPAGGDAAQAESLRRLAAGERVPPYEAVRMHRDGRPIPVSITAAPLHDATGRVVGVAGIVRDATERRDLEDRLRREKETSDLVRLAANDLIWDWDIQSGRVTRSNGIAAYGYTPDDIAENVRLAALVHPDDEAAVRASIAAALESDQTIWSAAFRFRRKDGTYASVVDRGFIVRDAAGRAVRMVGSLLDVTERDRMQEVAKRSAASAELLSRANHELRTPLNAILGFSDLLEQRLAPTLEARERRYLQNIRRSGEHLLALIDRLLQLAKADSGKLELQRSVIGLRALVEQPVADAAHKADGAGVTITIDPLPQASVRIDRAHLAAVLSELLANAILATPPGGTVRVRASVPDDDLLLEVLDTGRGIPPEASDRVFGVFERIHDEDHTGTGLGLALSREIVEVHGGTISFESEPGRGTTFRVHIPHVAWQRQSGERVLIVEDDPNDADLAMSICTEAGIRCEVVGTIAEALTSIDDELPRAAVVDLHLPDGSGREVLAALRAASRGVPMLLVTAEADTRAGARRGEHATKPIDPAWLRSWLLAATVAVATPAEAATGKPV